MPTACNRASLVWTNLSVRQRRESPGFIVSIIDIDSGVDQNNARTPRTLNFHPGSSIMTVLITCDNNNNHMILSHVFFNSWTHPLRQSVSKFVWNCTNAIRSQCILSGNPFALFNAQSAQIPFGQNVLLQSCAAKWKRRPAHSPERTSRALRDGAARWDACVWNQIAWVGVNF